MDLIDRPVTKSYGGHSEASNRAFFTKFAPLYPSRILLKPNGDWRILRLNWVNLNEKHSSRFIHQSYNLFGQVQESFGARRGCFRGLLYFVEAVSQSLFGFSIYATVRGPIRCVLGRFIVADSIH